MEEKQQQDSLQSQEVNAAETSVEQGQDDQRKLQLEQAKSNFANREVKEPKRGKRWLSIAFFVVVVALTMVLMYQLSESAAQGNQKTLAEIFANMNWRYATAALAVLATMMLLDCTKYFVIIHATTGKLRPLISAKTAFLGKYYDCITPFSSGGQPFQIHYLYKSGLHGGESTAVICIKFCFNVLTWLAICFSLMVFNKNALVTYVADETQRNFFSVMGWIGFALNAFIPLGIIAFAVLPKMTEILTRWILTIGNKLRIVKNKDAIVLKAKRGARDFRSAFVLMGHKPLHTIALLLCCVLDTALSMMLPYFVVVALAGSAVTPSIELMFAIMTMNVYVAMSVTIVPTPGNSGAMESAFMLILTSVAEGVLFWAVFVWRFLSYYTYIIIGLCIVVAAFFQKNKRTQ